jgi:hypothetical protein
MARSRKPGKDEATASAQVFLRTKSGRSVRELASGPLPEDLAAYRAPADAVQAVVHYLEQRGFRCFRDEMGLALTIEGSTSVFTKVFGVASETVRSVRAATSVHLRAPREIDAYVDEIVVTPRPELFRGR